MINTPKILYFDIETTPCIANVWSCGKQYVSAHQIRKERVIICICYIFEGQKKVTKLSFDQNKYDLTSYDDDSDKQLVKDFLEVYNSADLVVAHNGKNFDISIIRSRLIKYKLPDIMPVLIDDSYLSSKSIGFISHKMDHLGRFLGEGRKDSTTYQLWLDVMEKSKKALNEMVAYCATDVIRLKDIYTRLKPYIKSKLNLAIANNDSRLCPSCGKKTLTKAGIRISATRQIKQRMLCTSCGRSSTLGSNQIKPGDYPT